MWLIIGQVAPKLVEPAIRSLSEYGPMGIMVSFMVAAIVALWRTNRVSVSNTEELKKTIESSVRSQEGMMREISGMAKVVSESAQVAAKFNERVLEAFLEKLK
jgi:gas vesicle protein